MYELVGQAYDFEQVTVGTAAVSLTATKITPASTAPASAAFLQASGAAVYYRCDGEDPTTSVGHALGVGSAVTIYTTHSLLKLRAVCESAAGRLNVIYLR